MIQRRYWILTRCFPLPLSLHQVDHEAKAALLNPKREKMTEIHKKPYQHIKPMDTQQICSCHSCLFAWNNLCIVLDFAHFQKTCILQREPIPMIPRGTNPEWNLHLTEAHAAIVEHAMRSPLCYASILEKHLNSIVSMLSRQVKHTPHIPVHRHGKAVIIPTTRPVVQPNRLYQLTDLDVEAGTDEFLQRQGDPSYQMPFHRDNYYNQSMNAYVPNRKWSKEEQRWIYYAAGGHGRDLAWAKAWFGGGGQRPPPPPHQVDQEAFIASFKAAMTTT